MILYNRLTMDNTAIINAITEQGRIEKKMDVEKIVGKQEKIKVKIKLFEQYCMGLKHVGKYQKVRCKQ